jgi:signal transduction histidine kinase
VTKEKNISKQLLPPQNSVVTSSSFNYATFLAHEIRNPLGAIRLCLSLLESEVDKPEKVIEMSHRINRNVEVLNEIVSNVLELSKNSGNNFSKFDLLSLVKDLITEMTSFINSDGIMEVKSENSCLTLGNPLAIKQVLRNLIFNALHFTQYSGKIVVSLTERSENIRCEVCDNGPGIPKSFINSIFEPYKTNRPEGSGLGLAIAARIIRDHGGRCGAYNSQLGGAVVWFEVKKIDVLGGTC